MVWIPSRGGDGMSMISKLTMLSASSGGFGSTWLAEFSSSISSSFLYRPTYASATTIAPLASGVVAVGQHGNLTPITGSVFTINSNAKVGWSVQLTDGSDTTYPSSVNVDGDNNVWVTTRQISSPYRQGVHKLSGANGSAILGFDISPDSLYYPQGKGAWDDGTNFWMSWRLDQTGAPGNQEGTGIRGFNKATGTSAGAFCSHEYNNTDIPIAVGVDTSGNRYYVHRSPLNNYSGLFSKTNSSGTQQWARYYGTSGFGPFVFPTCGYVDASGNMYAAGYQSYSSPGFWFMSADSSGSLSWQKRNSTWYSGTGESVGFTGMKPLSSGDFIVCGYAPSSDNPSAYYAIIVLRITASGSLVWSKFIYTTRNMFTADVAIDANDDVFISGYGTPTDANALFVLRMTGDGLTNGTYGDYTVADTSLTLTTNTLSFTSYGSNYSASLSRSVASHTYGQTSDTITPTVSPV